MVSNLPLIHCEGLHVARARKRKGAPQARPPIEQKW